MVHRRPIPRAPRYRKAGGHLLRRRWLALGVVLLAGLLLAWEGLFRLAPEDLPTDAVQAVLTQTLHQAAEEALEEISGELVQLESDGAGNVTGASADARQLEALKAAVLTRLEDRLARGVKVRVALGTLTGLKLLHGAGPAVEFPLDLETVPQVEFESGFTSAGWNQSCYRLTMEVSVSAASRSRQVGGAAEAKVSILLAEQVIVGKVPGVWTTAGGG